jgi:signal transduction histidine kinase
VPCLPDRRSVGPRVHARGDRAVAASRILIASSVSYRWGVHRFLGSVWREPRAPDPPPRQWWDWLLTAVVAAGALVEGVLRTDVPSRGVWVPIAVLLAVALLWRRTRPLLVVAVTFATSAVATLVLGGEQSGLYTMAVALLLPYALFRWGSGREVLLGSGFLLVGLGAAAATSGSVPDAVAGATVLSSSVALGLAVRFRAAARARELDRVALLERERLARDLHDTVAHHVSAMAIRAQAGLATAATRPEAAVEALRLIEAESARTLVEMRAIVRALRRDRPPDPAHPGSNPGIADVRALAGAGSGGPRVDVAVSGDVDDLGPAVGAAVYRLAQEAVTNAVRHALGATRVEVRVSTDDRSVHLRVSDDGDSGGARGPASGYGIPGMIERADLLGGRCAAGPDPAGGWTVTAVLPRAGSAR